MARKTVVQSIKGVISKRKRIARQQARKHGRSVQWIGGILYFSDDRKRVPGVEAVAKPDQNPVGIPEPFPSVKAQSTHFAGIRTSRDGWGRWSYRDDNW